MSSQVSAEEKFVPKKLSSLKLKTRKPVFNLNGCELIFILNNGDTLIKGKVQRKFKD